MPTSTSTLVTSTSAMGGGVDAVAPRGPTYRITFGGTWAAEDTWTMSVTATSGDLLLGFGRISDGAGTWGFVLNQKVYLANGLNFDFSDSDDPTGWEIQNPGAGFIPFTTQYGAYDNVQSFAANQGRLAVLGRRSVQLWNVDADPAAYSLAQSLTEVGTIAPPSVASLGQLETIFLADNGFRSLRTRETTLNAFVADLGSPIDSFIIAAFNGMSDAQKAASPAVVEPATGRYWGYVKDTIYVLSFFPSSGVTAWSTYKTTYWQRASVGIISGSAGSTYGVTLLKSDGTTQLFTTTWNTDVTTTAAALATAITAAAIGYTATNVAGAINITANFVGAVVAYSASIEGSMIASNIQASFAPDKLFIASGRVYALATSGVIYSYGGSSGYVYDTCVATAELPWLDGKTPFNNKEGVKVNAAITGGWSIYSAMDCLGNSLVVSMPVQTTPVGAAHADSTFGKDSFGLDQIGSHFKFKAVSSNFWPYAAVVSALTMQYNLGSEV